MKRIILLTAFANLWMVPSVAQTDMSGTGAWYMYFFNARFNESRIGFQGDLQYRNWNLGGDLEQLLLRGGLNFQPVASDARFALGYANITSGAIGESKSTSMEHRVYQEALLPHRPLKGIFLTHRFRFEQRFVEDQDRRTRFRYALFMDIPLNREKVEQGTIYLALYNELFVNGERDIGKGRSVEVFDRNRTYLGIGYGWTDQLRVQAGWMRQVTDQWARGQLQLSLHHRIF